MGAAPQVWGPMLARRSIMAEQIRKGTTVEWKWGSNKAQGKVVEVHKDKVERESKGSTITRNGSDDDPALEIEQEDGTTVLKLRSEVGRP